jgi:hypothetical protein
MSRSGPVASAAYPASGDENRGAFFVARIGFLALIFTAGCLWFSLIMKHYNFTKDFHAIYDRAVTLYAGGKRDASTFFTADETAWLAGNGLAPQHLYDYAEDQCGYGEPGFDIALSIELVRRDYFINAQGSEPSTVTLDEATLPPKTDEVRGIAWLPRLIPKAKAKLRGELPKSLMYCCGGDRAFFKKHDIQPGEFLSSIWASLDDDEALIEWLLPRAILDHDRTLIMDKPLRR